MSIAVLVGCGGTGDRPRLGRVEGAITLDGKPLARCAVYFEPKENRTSMGFTDDSGRYELRYIRDIKGAAVGDHVVRVQDATGRNRVPRQYHEMVKTVTVESGSNEINFDLTTDG